MAYTLVRDAKEQDGVLHLTEAVNNQFGGAILNNLAKGDEDITFTFKYYSGEGSGADGFSFWIADGEKHDGHSIGGFGGALGYIPNSPEGSPNCNPGVPHAYLGVGFDEYGYFGVAHGGQQNMTKDHVILRGSGHHYDGYRLLSCKHVGGLSGGWRKVKIDIDLEKKEGVKCTVDMTWYKNGSDSEEERTERIFDHFDVLACPGQGAIPKKFRVGFAAATGGCTNKHYAKDLKIDYKKPKKEDKDKKDKKDKEGDKDKKDKDKKDKKDKEGDKDKDKKDKDKKDKDKKDKK